MNLTLCFNKQNGKFSIDEWSKAFQKLLDMDLREQTEIMVKYMLSAEKESVEDKEIVNSYVDAMMLMYEEYEVSKNESLQHDTKQSRQTDCRNKNTML